ncbi:uncharacterized protein G2W53_008209 [Senna tora]|uniref:Uncharacterized protein n=1 Tax=Senna tora TaxID=362788 RepID=A0A834X8A5_9FABA|nr:uncharacterized protein G2W53_008209 [Senna tora]
MISQYLPPRPVFFLFVSLEGDLVPFVLQGESFPFLDNFFLSFDTETELETLHPHHPGICYLHLIVHHMRMNIICVRDPRDLFLGILFSLCDNNLERHFVLYDISILLLVWHWNKRASCHLLLFKFLMEILLSLATTAFPVFKNRSRLIHYGSNESGTVASSSKARWF